MGVPDLAPICCRRPGFAVPKFDGCPGFGPFEERPSGQL